MRWTAPLLFAAACGFHAPAAGNGDGGGGSGDGGDSGDGGAGRWWDPAWSSRMRISIDTAVALPQGFQLGVPRDLDVAPCAGSRDAVRVVRDHATELPRVIDELEGDEWIWFRLAAPLAASAGPSEYWLYCGNPGAAAAPKSPTDVFDAYDDFVSTSLSTAWVKQGTVSVGNGTLAIGGGDDGVHSTMAYGAGTAVDFILEASSGALASPWFWGGFEIAFTVTAPWVIWHCHEPSTIKQEIRIGSSTVAMRSRALDTAPHLLGVEHYGTSAGFRYHDAFAGSIPYGGTITQAMNVRLHNYQSGGPIQFHMARVRKAVDPIPTVTLGDVELRP